MKKIIISLSLVFVVLGAIAQDSLFTNKRGVPVLPQAGDIAIGLDAASPLYYIGNAFNGNTDNWEPNANFFNNGLNNTIYFKYFLTDQSALRMNFTFGKTNFNNKTYVQDDSAFAINPLSNAMVEDMFTQNSTRFALGLGFEQRKGRNRVQGFYGAGTYFAYENSSYTYAYGNPISELNPMPTSTNWMGQVTATTRELSRDLGSQYTFGLNAFIGVEYFILPSVSLGAELGYGYGLTSQTQESHVYEYWNVSKVEEMTVLDAPGTNHHWLGVANPSANFFLMFNF